MSHNIEIIEISTYSQGIAKHKLWRFLLCICNSKSRHKGCDIKIWRM